MLRNKKNESAESVKYGFIYVGVLLSIFLFFSFGYRGMSPSDPHISSWIKAARRGDQTAKANLGISFYFGLWVRKNEEEAERWFREASNDAVAKAFLNKDFGITRELKYSEDQISLLQKAADKGEAEAQARIGLAYILGEGVKGKLNEGAGWCRKGAEQGNAEAQYCLGLAYFNGEGVGKDYNEAISWWRKSAEQDFRFAQKTLEDEADVEDGEGYVMQSTYPDPQIDKWREKAELGNAEAQNNIGVAYCTGVQRNYKEAVRWWQKAADQGDTEAMVNLGNAYREGRGIKKDNSRGLELYRKAAEMGSSHAQEDLGTIYRFGDEEVKIDYQESIKWYTKAALQGNPVAQASLKLLKGEIETDKKK